MVCAGCRQMLIEHQKLRELRGSTKRIYTDLFWGLYRVVRVGFRGVRAGFKEGCAVDGTFPGSRMPRTVGAWDFR